MRLGEDLGLGRGRKPRARDQNLEPYILIQNIVLESIYKVSPPATSAPVASRYPGINLRPLNLNLNPEPDLYKE